MECNVCGDLWECVDGDEVCPDLNTSPEVCNGLDDDCNGLIDDGVTLPCGGCDGSGTVNPAGAAGM